MRNLLRWLWTNVPVLRLPKKLLSNVRLARRLSKPGPYLLNFGTGPYPKAGWINTDISARADYYLDASVPLPIPDNSIDAVFSEHLIEHLKFNDSMKWLSECFRCLRSGGTFRCATPGLKQLYSFYEGDMVGVSVNELLDRHYSRFSNDILKGYGIVPPKSLCVFLNDKLRLWGHHQFIYDEQLLSEILERLGFIDIKIQQYGKSLIPYLDGLESHAGDDDWMKDECFVIEATKP
jgi:SAM-dependent methyltransferase